MLLIQILVKLKNLCLAIFLKMLLNFFLFLKVLDYEKIGLIFRF